MPLLLPFTDELFHAGGDNSTKKEIYRLFAYVVSDEKDYPNNMVFTKKQGEYEKAKCRKETMGVRFTNRPNWY